MSNKQNGVLAVKQKPQRPVESDYISQVAYTRALEAYCDGYELMLGEVAQPAREWVGLDDTDLAVCDTDGVLVARYWERALREKNT